MDLLSTPKENKIMAVITNDRAAYRILSEKGFWGPDDFLYKEGSCIYFDGIPNEDMEPLNQPAREKMITYLEYLDKNAAEAAARTGRTFQGRARSVDEALQNARYDEEYKFKIRGVHKENTGIESAEPEAVAEMGRKNKFKSKGVSSIAA